MVIFIVDKIRCRKGCVERLYCFTIQRRYLECESVMNNRAIGPKLYGYPAQKIFVRFKVLSLSAVVADQRDW